jgi:hypothetical protein
MYSADSQIFLLVIAGVVALALLLQAIVLVAIFFGLRKGLKAAQKEVADLRASTMPYINDGRDFFTRVAPKIEETTADLAAITHAVRVQTRELQAVTTELVEKARTQGNRLDSMTTALLDSADRAGAFLSSAIHKPMRQASGILASVKAVVETLRAPEPVVRARANQSAGDPEMFV